MIQIPNIVAVLAPFFTCIQLLPQIYKTYITKRVSDLSFYSILLLLITNLLWLLRGYYILDYPLIITGVFTMIINIALLTLYLIYK